MMKKLFGKSLLVLAAFCIIFTSLGTAEASKDEWFDKGYNYKAVGTVYMEDLDPNGKTENIAQTKNIQEIFKEAGEKGKYQTTTMKERADIVIKPVLERYEVTSIHYDAYTSWENKTMTKTEKDKDGKTRQKTYTIPVEVRHPARDVATAAVKLTVHVYDKHGEEIGIYSEERLHEDSTNMKGVFGRISKAFFSSLNKRIK